mmetsp:Transcript_21316/g.43854  ORF Transcript_21316/g.43854 Transcript_21316/m.43854 type:complete len:164 (-) Transcript_21316:534-1025(-)
MMRQATTFAIVLCAMQLASQAEAFATLPQSKMTSSSSLDLLPSQANQLVAAYNAISVEKEVVESAIKVDKDVEKKSFLTRVFHLPSIKQPGQNENDVVYYPMVGFRFFEGINSVFPTTSHVSCMMPTKGQKEEEVFGWFSSSCKLDLFSDDVCQNPIGSETDE